MPTTERPGLGHMKDPEDARDRDFDLLGLSTTALPESATEMSAHYSIANQRSTNACTGFAARQAIRIWQASNLGEVQIDPSALACYYNGRVFHIGLKELDQGGYIRSVFRGLNEYGIAPNEAWPFDLAKVTSRPSVSAFLKAYKARRARYRRIFASGDALIDRVRASIASKRPVVFGIPVHESFLPSRGPERIVAPDDPGDELAGWHAIEADSFEDFGEWFGIGNSWGSWRGDGRAWLHRDYILRGVDFWSIEMVDP